MKNHAAEMTEHFGHYAFLYPEVCWDNVPKPFAEASYLQLYMTIIVAVIISMIYLLEHF